MLNAVADGRHRVCRQRRRFGPWLAREASTAHTGAWVPSAGWAGWGRNGDGSVYVREALIFAGRIGTRTDCETVVDQMNEVDRMNADEPGVSDDGRRALLTAMVTDEPQRLRRRGISLGVAPDDADDVAQTALLRAWRSIEHLHAPEPGQMCSWLDTIARNAAIDLARVRSRRPADALEGDLPDPTSVAVEVEMRLVLDQALVAIHALPQTLREPLLLSVVDQLSAAEIGARLAITPATARQRIARARKALATCRQAGMSDAPTG